MDFVVAGLGIGALLVVIGFAVRDLGPLIGASNSVSRNGQPGQSPRRVELIITIWLALTVAGGLILIATIAAIFLGVSDSAGTWMVAASVVAGAGVAAALVFRSLRAWPSNSFASLRTASSPHGIASARPGSSLPAAATRAKVDRQAPANQPAAADVGVGPAIVASSSVPDDEPFDPTKLLPQEFGDHGESGNDLDVLLGVPRPVPAPNLEESPAVQAPEAMAEIGQPTEETPATDAEANAPPVPEPPLATAAPDVPADAPIVGMAGFRSPLLADIDVEEPGDEPSRFSSELLAGVAPDETTGDSFASPLLADVTANSGPELIGPSAPKTASLAADGGEADADDAGEGNERKREAG